MLYRSGDLSPLWRVCVDLAYGGGIRSLSRKQRIDTHLLVELLSKEHLPLCFMSTLVS